MAAEATVVIVEDDRELAAAYADWLSEAYVPRTAHDASEALERIDDEVDAVLLDRRLPDRPGSDVLAELRRRGIDCPVAIITAVDPDFDVVEMGFDDYIVKPVRRAEFIEIVDRLLRISRYDDDAREAFGLVKKVAALEREKSPAELEASEEYTGMKARFEAVQRRIEETLSDFEDDDFTAAYRSITGESGDSGP